MMRLFGILLSLCFVVPSVRAEVGVGRLRCEYAHNPKGIDIPQPRLSWELTSRDRGQRQTAYQILVASNLADLARSQGDLWDSGKVDSADSIHVQYGGAPLKSSQQVFWKVRVWDRDDKASDWSPAAEWTMGVLDPKEWKGRWIVAPWSSEGLLLRREILLDGDIRRGVLHVCGLGQYEAYINGAKVSEDLLSPGWTNYDRTTLYDTHDVTDLLRKGNNAIGLSLGNGMYHVVRRDRFAKFVGSFGPLRANLHLEVEYVDGRRMVIGTDDSWKVHRGAIKYNSIYGGEDYDARLEPVGWKLAGFADAEWERAVYWVRPPQTLRGFSRAAEPLRVIERRRPTTVKQIAPGVVLYNFGQNASFMPRLRVKGPAGSTVRLTPGEVVREDGTIERGTMGGAHRGSAWWQYTKATDGEETWFPQFYYVGSRYIHAELLPPQGREDRPSIVELESTIVHSIAEPIGEFATSNPLLNRIRDLVRWAQRSNMVSILTDCPHREKLGWIEQYHLNGPSIRYEFDVARIYAKGMYDMAEAQTTEGLIPNIAPEYTQFKGAFRGAAEWGAAFFLVPLQQYEFNGDLALMRQHYDAMKRYFAYLENRTKDGLLADGLGDWYDYVAEKKGRAGLTPAPITATAFLYEDARALSRIARLLGRAEDADHYARRADEIRTRYNREFAKPEEGSYGTGSQCSLALALAMDLAPAEQRAALIANLVKDVETRGYATAGDIGFRYLLLALAENGRSDVIYRLINQDQKPGYGFQLRMGATALTEAWDANLGASHNHFMLGQVTEWFYRYVAGISPDPEAPGFKHIRIRPEVLDDLDWVDAKYRTMYGNVAVKWERSDRKVLLRVVIPVNTTATVYVPDASGSVREGDQPAERSAGVTFVRREPGRAVYQVGSGEYHFESDWNAAHAARPATN
jgi:alpha-L-rhamnosidase